MSMLDTFWRRFLSRYTLPPASAEAAVAALESGATLMVPREDVRHIVEVAERDGRLPVLDSRPFTDDDGRAMVRLKKGRKPRRKKR